MQTVLEIEKKPTFKEFKEQTIYFFQSRGMTGTAQESMNDFLFEPETYTQYGGRDDFFDGLMLNYFSNDNIFEVAEYQAGKNKNELHIYKETRSLTEALEELLKGNKRKPIKIWK